VTSERAGAMNAGAGAHGSIQRAGPVLVTWHEVARHALAVFWDGIVDLSAWCRLRCRNRCPFRQRTPFNILLAAGRRYPSFCADR
jgi:hypothetical protein